MTVDRQPTPAIRRPGRIQRVRRKGWRMPPNTVYVGRPTVFGNPIGCIQHGCYRKPCGCCEPYFCCVDKYEEYVRSGLENRPSLTRCFAVCFGDAAEGYPVRSELVRRLPELRGKNLCCWCPLDRPCHADVLLELANA